MSARRALGIGLALAAAVAVGVWGERIFTLRLVLNHLRNSRQTRGWSWKR